MYAKPMFVMVPLMVLMMVVAACGGSSETRQDAGQEQEIASESSIGSSVSSARVEVSNPAGDSLAQDVIPLKETKLIIEHNATDEDTGFQGFIDSEGWERLEMTAPGGSTVLSFQGQGALGNLGLTELFFETV